MKYALLLLLLLLPGFVLAAQLKRIQTNEITIGTTAGGVNDSIAYVNTSASVLFFSIRANDAASGNGQVRCALNATQVTCLRRSATGADTLYIRYYVVEFKNGVSVQRGTTTVSAGNVTTAISSVNTSATFIVTGGQDTSGTTWGGDDFIMTTLQSSTAVNFISGAASYPSEWQAVSFTGAVVQRGYTALASGTGTINATITVVNTSKSFLLFSYNTTPGTAANMGEKMVRGIITNSTTVQFVRNNTGTDMTVYWEVITLPGAERVQNGTFYFPAGSATGTLGSINPVDLGKALPFSPSQAALGQSSGATVKADDDQPGGATYIFSFPNASRFQITRTNTSNESEVSWQIIEFNASYPVANSVTINTTDGSNRITKNITAYANVTDPDGDTVRIMYDWRWNGASIALLNMNFDVNESGGANKTKDYSSFSNNISGNVPWNATGGYNNTGGYMFNGIDQQMRVYNITLPRANGTISLWWRPDEAAGSTLHPLIRAGFSSPLQLFDIYSFNDGKLYAGWYNNGNDDRIPWTIAGISQGTWYHIVVTWENGGYTFLYVNGVLKANTSGLDATFDTTAGATNIMSDVLFSTYAQGAIDNFIILNRSLSQQEITALYNNRTDLIVSQGLANNSNWSVCITPNDGLSDGSTLCSGNVSIISNSCSPPANLNWTIYADDQCNLTDQRVSLGNGYLFVRDPGTVILTRTNITAKNIFIGNGLGTTKVILTGGSNLARVT
jgi:hypothetical protein